ncbi:uncharacterized protein C8Q71DRAFT_788689 [Rhodofomes roseus]|uniref:Uncharacterized protein n=1 Tax=Rhodofomes roseus TaxID=34475 RepID=A0ABQ8JZM1_9APHY|nr:uncharacterized protein C8Q71DRAFT_788689 [Rhodofomes roseus]KAH9829835.1 hypothetical protein C8Q71DRAFT_788689 [Rhodofomes roseus]
MMKNGLRAFLDRQNHLRNSSPPSCSSPLSSSAPSASSCVPHARHARRKHTPSLSPRSTRHRSPYRTPVTAAGRRRSRSGSPRAKIPGIVASVTAMDVVPLGDHARPRCTPIHTCIACHVEDVPPLYTVRRGFCKCCWSVPGPHVLCTVFSVASSAQHVILYSTQRTSRLLKNWNIGLT